MARAGALGPDAASVSLDQPLADGQTQAVSPATPLPVFAGAAGVLPEQVGSSSGGTPRPSSDTEIAT